MDNSRNPLLSWSFFLQGKSMEELKHSLLCTTVELEQTRIAVQEELRKRDEQVIHLKDLLKTATRERDEANEKCQRLLLEKLLYEQTQQNGGGGGPNSGVSSIEDEQNPRRGDKGGGISSSDCEESIVSSPVGDPLQLQSQAAPICTSSMELMPEKPLPEKGKLLQAVMKAGPLLQTLFLAGPLPQWRHPPPPLESFEIPPVAIPSPPPPHPPPTSAPTQLLHHHHYHSQDSFNTATNYCGRVNRKRVFSEDYVSPTDTKYQRLVLH